MNIFLIKFQIVFQHSYNNDIHMYSQCYMIKTIMNQRFESDTKFYHIRKQIHANVSLLFNQIDKIIANFNMSLYAQNRLHWVTFNCSRVFVVVVVVVVRPSFARNRSHLIARVTVGSPPLPIRWVSHPRPRTFDGLG